MADLRLVVNYSAPSAGFTRACPIQATFTAVPFNIDFKALEGSNLADTPFRPTGVYIDNTQSVNPLTVLINEINFRIICPAGAALNLPYPAPAYSTASITGNGPASLVFVDYPVQPYSSASGGSSVATAWGTITGTLSAQTDLQNALNLKITNPMTAVGDLIMGSTAGAPVALSIGSAGQVLKVAGGVATWSTLSKTDVGLGNVDNTSDANKPVSTAQQAALNLKVDIAGSVISVAGRAGAVVLAKADVGLSNVDNTSDLNKPISTATQTALNAKSSLGVGQTWQDVTASRVLGTTYTNSTGAPIQVVALLGPSSAINVTTQVTINGGVVVTGSYAAIPNTFLQSAMPIIPSGQTYKIMAANGTAALVSWLELR